MSNIIDSDDNRSIITDKEYELGYSFETGDGVAQDYNQAQIHYRNSKSPLSDYRLGCMAAEGKLGAADYKKAFRWISKSASAGYYSAKLKLAEFYAEGVGVDADPFEAVRICIELYRSENDEGLKKQAMETLRSIPDKFNDGSPMHEYSLGLLCEATSSDGNLEEAISHYEKAGGSGHVDALYRAGVLSETKNPPDYPSAIRYYSKAYQLEDDRSAIRLGVLCYEGRSTPQDIGLSFRFFRKAADLGNHRGQYWSAIMMSCGILTDKDVHGAIRLFKDAYEGGVKAASVWLGVLFRRGEDIPKDPVSALKWLRAAADLGFGRAMYELGQMYDVGSGVQADMTQAREYYGKANRNGCPVVNGRIDPVEPHVILEKDFEDVESEYLQTLVSVDNQNVVEEGDLPNGSASNENVEPDSEETPTPQPSSESVETPVELLKRLSGIVNRGGPDAEDAQREARFLFDSCFGLDSDFDAMWRLYTVALSKTTLAELKYRMAQMMADSESPIYNIEKAFKWFEDSYKAGCRAAAISMGDYYLEGVGPFPRDLLKASRLYIDATRNRSEFRKVEGRFDSIGKIIGASRIADDCVIIARLLDKSNVAGHDSVLRFYTIALEKGCNDVSKDLYTYCRRNGLRYDPPKLLHDSLLSLKQNGDDDPLLTDGLRDYSIRTISANGTKVQSSANNRNKTPSQASVTRNKKSGKAESGRRLHDIRDTHPDKASCLKNDLSKSGSRPNPIQVCAEGSRSTHLESNEKSKTDNRELKSDGNVRFEDKDKVRISTTNVSIPVLSGEEIAKLYPQIALNIKDSVISSIESSVKTFINNPDAGIQSIASLTSNPSKVVGIYQSIPDGPVLDLVYKLGLRLCSDYEYIGYCLICTAALSNHKAALDSCADKIDIYATQNMDLAVEILCRSVSSHNPKSMFKLALLYERYPAYGSVKEADRLLLRAVELEDPDALKLVVTRMRSKRYTQNELKTARRSIQNAANKGFAQAMLSRGEQCWNTDPEEAIDWFTKAANKGNADAMCRLGLIYKDNSDFRNIEKAISYLSKAGNLKNREALFHLGELFELIDTRRSQDYYRKSSDLGCSKASQKLYKKDTFSYKLSYHHEIRSHEIRPIGIFKPIPDDSGRYINESSER